MKFFKSFFDSTFVTTTDDILNQLLINVQIYAFLLKNTPYHAIL